MREKKYYAGVFWTFMFIGAALILLQRGYSDGDDVYFYQYTHAMNLPDYLRFRYETWVGRMAAEALVYVTFYFGIWFWRMVNALMLVLLPLGVLRLAGTVSGMSWENVYVNLTASVAAVGGYLLMGAMTLGYAAVWVNGSIFYTWTFTCGIWAMVPLAELVFSGGVDAGKFLYGIPCAIIASMSIEQMGAVLLTFEVLGVLYCLIKERRVNAFMLIQTILTFAAFFILFAAPGNELRVAAEVTTWMPEFETMSFGQHLYITVQWLLSSFANENKLFLCGIWMVGIMLLKQKEERRISEEILIRVAGIFSVAAVLPFIGVTVLSDMGIGAMDITSRIDRVPAFSDATALNIAAMVWWTGALVFTFIFLWKVSKFGITLLLAYLAGIASEAIMFFSPTMYASGARVYYLTDWLYLFVILALSFKLKKEKQSIFYAIMVILGVLNFVFQIPTFLAQI